MSQLFNPPALKRQPERATLPVALLVVCLLAAASACNSRQDLAAGTSPAAPAQPGGTADTLRLIDGETAFYVDSLNGKAPDKKIAPVIVDAKVLPAFGIGGWAVDQKAQREAGGVIVTVDGKVDIPMSYGHERPDVVKFLKGSNYLRSGFTGAISTASLEPGLHTLTFKILTADKAGYYKPKEEINVEIQK